MRSKAHWGYDQTFLQQVKDELTYHPEDCLNHPTFVATEGDQLLGFYQLIRLVDQRYELEAMFVEPAHMGQGIGRQLFQHLARLCVTLGVSEVVIQADPYAEGFYLNEGCVRVGSRPSGSIPGRELPVLLFKVPSANI